MYILVFVESSYFLLQMYTFRPLLIGRNFVDVIFQYISLKSFQEETSCFDLDLTAICTYWPNRRLVSIGSGIDLA